MYDSTGIMGQEFRSSLASYFWPRVFSRVSVKMLAGLPSSEGLTGTQGSASKMVPPLGKFISVLGGLSSLTTWNSFSVLSTWHLTLPGAKNPGDTNMKATLPFII